jgi:hypothetical protein
VVDDSLNETPNLPALPDDPGQFILYQTEDGRTRVEVRIFRETVWLSQKAMAGLFQKDDRTINEHIRNVFSEGELREPEVIRKFQITASTCPNATSSPTSERSRTMTRWPRPSLNMRNGALNRRRCPARSRSTSTRQSRRSSAWNRRRPKYPNLIDTCERSARRGKDDEWQQAYNQ